MISIIKYLLFLAVSMLVIWPVEIAQGSKKDPVHVAHSINDFKPGSPHPLPFNKAPNYNPPNAPPNQIPVVAANMVKPQDLRSCMGRMR